MRKRTQAARTLGGRASSRAADGLRLSMYSSARPRQTLCFENHPAAAGRGRDPSPTWVAGPFLGEMESI
jgi:hypothetical protein